MITRDGGWSGIDDDQGSRMARDRGDAGRGES